MKNENNNATLPPLQPSDEIIMKTVRKILHLCCDISEELYKRAESEHPAKLLLHNFNEGDNKK